MIQYWFVTLLTCVYVRTNERQTKNLQVPNGTTDRKPLSAVQTRLPSYFAKSAVNCSSFLSSWITVAIMYACLCMASIPIALILLFAAAFLATSDSSHAATPQLLGRKTQPPVHVYVRISDKPKLKWTATKSFPAIAFTCTGLQSTLRALNYE